MRRLASIRLPGRPALIAGIAVALLAGGWLWLRDSALVRVREVTVLGLSSSQEREIRAALVSAARDMTTLHVREDQLRTAAKPFPTVAGLRIRTDFPRRMVIEVIERRPVAAIELGGRRMPVGANGLVMRGVRADAHLPTVRARALTAGSRLSDPRALRAVDVLAAAPERLRRRVDEASWGPRGLVLDLRHGPDLVFGDDRARRAKWAAAARVLAEESAAGAVYLDVRIPERVAAGGLGPLPTPTPEQDSQVEVEGEPTLNP